MQPPCGCSRCSPSPWRCGCPILASDFPINDGGIFFVMAGELSDAHLALPAETTYNNAHIPFAYPPLGLYVAAALHFATGCPS